MTIGDERGRVGTIADGTSWDDRGHIGAIGDEGGHVGAIGDVLEC